MKILTLGKKIAVEVVRHRPLTVAGETEIKDDQVVVLTDVLICSSDPTTYNGGQEFLVHPIQYAVKDREKLSYIDGRPVVGTIRLRRELVVSEV